MILTVTLNTSIDKAYRISSTLERGTVMRVAECIDNAGGKGLNASRSVATCGEKVLSTGFVGGNNGRLLCELLDRDKIPHDFVKVATETRCCVNVLEPDGQFSTEFLEPGREVTSEELAALEERLVSLVSRADVVTMSGSFPKGLPADTYVRLIKLVRSQGKPCILDTSGATLKASIDALPTMVKPNTDEIGQYAGSQGLLGGGGHRRGARAPRARNCAGGGLARWRRCRDGMRHGDLPGDCPQDRGREPRGGRRHHGWRLCRCHGPWHGARRAAALRDGLRKRQLHVRASTGHFDMEVARGLMDGTRVERVA